MKKDIADKDDVKKLVDRFYQKVVADDQIGFIFKNTLESRLQAHMPTMYGFWDSVLFSTGEYRGNLMLVHIALHKKQNLTTDHFNRWIQLWNQSIDELYAGDIADLAKQKAMSMKQLMLYKIKASENPNFVQ